MRIPNDIRRRMLLALCMVVGIAVYGGVHEISWAETEQDGSATGVESVTVGCERGDQVSPGDTCTWTIEGDTVEIHVDAEGCALVTSKNYRMRYAHPGPRLCPGGEGFSTQGLSAVHVEDNIVTLTSEAPVCGVLSISRPSVAFDGTDIHVWPGLDLEGVMVRWSGAHWSVEETPSQGWLTPRQYAEVPACRSGQQLEANDVCRYGDHVAVIGQQAVRVDVWEDRRVGPEKWMVDPDGTCYALASMSARAFSAIMVGGVQLVWDTGGSSWIVVEPRSDE